MTRTLVKIIHAEWTPVEGPGTHLSRRTHHPLRGRGGRSYGTIGRMRFVLRRLELEPDPSTLPDDPTRFMMLARMIVGPPDAPGEESFDITVCSPEWLARACCKVGGIYNARHHVVVSFEDFDQGRCEHGYRRGCRRSRQVPGRRLGRDSASSATGSSRTTVTDSYRQSRVVLAAGDRVIRSIAACSARPAAWLRAGALRGMSEGSAVISRLAVRCDAVSGSKSRDRRGYPVPPLEEAN
jgi:hypothetical protein